MTYLEKGSRFKVGLPVVIVGLTLLAIFLIAHLGAENSCNRVGYAAVRIGVSLVIVSLVYYQTAAFRTHGWVRLWHERFFPVSPAVKATDVWKLRIVYGVLTFIIALSAADALLNRVVYGSALSALSLNLFLIICMTLFYLLARRGYWRVALWGGNILSTAALFIFSPDIERLNAIIVLAITPVILIVMLEGRLAGVALGAVTFLFYNWLVLQSGGQFNFYILLSAVMVGGLAYRQALQMQKVAYDEARIEEVARLIASRLDDAKARLDMVVLGVSHEMRTPLAIISGGIALVEMLQAGEDDGLAIGAVMSRVKEGVNRLQDLVTDMNVMAEGRDELGLNYRRLRLTSVVNEAIEAERGKCRTMTVQVADDIVVDADPLRLKQMLRALIENACLHGDGRVVVRAEKQGESARIHIEVADSGEGIPKTELPKVFAPFTRGDRAIGKPGRGMGLPTVRLLAEAHGGTAWIESEEGKGCRAVIRLPLRQPVQDGSGGVRGGPPSVRR